MTTFTKSWGNTHGKRNRCLLSCYFDYFLSDDAGILANRFMDEARERAERHKENDAIRRAEHPETAQPAAAPVIAAPAEAVTTQLVNVLNSAKVPARAE